MFISDAPASSASACPSPLYSQEFEVTLKVRPMPPVARMTVGASNRTKLPVSLTYPKQPGDRRLGVHLDPGLGVAELVRVGLLERDDPLLQGADHLQPGPVAHVRQPRVLVPAEVALGDLPVLGAVEDRAVRLELPDPVRGLLGVQLGHPRVVEELPAAHGVAEVDHPVVIRVHVAHGGGRAALGHDRVRLAEQRLGDDRRPQPAGAGLDGRAQPGPASADHYDVVGVPLDLGRGRGRGRIGGRHKPFRPFRDQLKMRGSLNAPLATSMM
jgi:hypothetical protein